jgi:hypothetical protein
VTRWAAGRDYSGTVRDEVVYGEGGRDAASTGGGHEVAGSLAAVLLVTPAWADQHPFSQQKWLHAPESGKDWSRADMDLPALTGWSRERVIELLGAPGMTVESASARIGVSRTSAVSVAATFIGEAPSCDTRDSPSEGSMGRRTRRVDIGR